MVKKKKKNVIMKAATDQVKVGAVSMGGMVAVGALSPLAPHSGPVVQATSAGLGLVNIGQMLKGGKDILGSFDKKTNKKSKAYKKIWG